MNYNNLAERTNFIAGSSAFSHIPFFLTSVNLPEINIQHPEVTGGRFTHNIKLPGDTIRYGTLNFEMLMDEDLLIYDELYRLLEKNTNPETNTFGDFSFDFFVEMNDNLGHPSLVFHFDNCRISSIGSLQLDVSDESTNYKLNIDLVFDRFYPIRHRKFNLSGEYDIIRHREFKMHEKEWTQIFNFDDYVVWGLPEPRKFHDAELRDVISMCQPVDTESESGMILRNGFNVCSDFEIFVSVKNTSSLRFGLTEGSGIKSVMNGRTGKTIIEYAPTSDGDYLIQKSRETIRILYLNTIPEGPEEPEVILETELCTFHTDIFLFFQGKRGTEITNIKYRLS